MKKLIIAGLLILVAKQSFAQKMYSVDYENQADVSVFVVDYANQADLKVFTVDYSNQAEGNNGLWFFTDYANQADKKIFFGGYSYPKQYSDKSRLRFRYGIKREFKSALKREIKPYRNIYSGNMLISRETFELINISLENSYGLDLAFSGQLEFHKIPFKHIDNYTCHRDIDDNNTFLLKSKEASITIRNLYDQGLINPKQSKLIWAYILIKKLHLIKIVKLKGRLLSPLIYWMLNNFRAPLITLDFYKLYHFCKK